MASPAASPVIADKQPAGSINTPRLPPGLEADIRAHMAVLNLLYRGKGHVSFRIDFAPDRPATWVMDVGGSGQERR